MLHSVGCSQPNAEVFVSQFNSSLYSSACVHGFIDANNGTVYQTLPWNHRGWHCGGSGNDTHIGVEMCEPDCITYISGANFTCSDLAKAQASATTAYNSAVELFAYLCDKYNLDPTAEGVVISHKEGYTLNIATGHVDPEHLWSGLGLSYTMDGFRADVKSKMYTLQDTSTYTNVMGKPTATVKQLRSYIKKTNPKVAKSVIKMARYYISEGKAEGVRGDIAFAQSCLETGNFTFKDSKVTLSQNNFCAMGVLSNSMKGNSFKTAQIGIRAQIQHLKAYASNEKLNQKCSDPRFTSVKRGCSIYVEWLGMQENPNGYGWAAGKDYGKKILDILSRILSQ